MTEQIRSYAFPGQFRGGRDQWIGNTINTAHFHQSGTPQAEGLSEPCIDIPFRRDRHFVKRKVFNDLVQRCQEKDARLALVGLGGVGKSQLAIELAYHLRERDPELWVFWVEGHSVARFEESYRRIAGHAHCLPPVATPVDVLRSVRAWLSQSSRRQWLMVVDNVDDEVVMFEAEGDRQPLVTHLASASSGRIIFTSRQRKVACRLVEHDDDILTIGLMSSEEAAELAQKRLKSDTLADQTKHIPTLVQQLGHMPLAISQAAAYINERYPRITVSSYVEELSRSEDAFSQLLLQETHDARRDFTAVASIMRTLHISFEYLHQRHPSAARLLALMSMFDRTNISNFLIHSQYDIGNNGSEMGIGSGNDTSRLAVISSFEDDISRLRSFDLIHVKANQKDVFEMHRLVQRSVQQWLTLRTEIDLWRGRSIAVLHEAFPTVEYEDWSKCRAIFPHIEEVMIKTPADKETRLQLAEVIAFAGYFAMLQGWYATALKMCERAFESQKCLNGGAHPHTLMSMHFLSEVLKEQGQYTTAEQLERDALASWQKLSMLEHSAALRSMHNLAEVLRYQGRYTEAEQMHRAALAGHKKLHGIEHSLTLTSMHSLACVLTEQGQYTRAETIYRDVLVAKIRVVGLDHPATLTSMHNLADVLREQGRYMEAERMQKLVGTKCQKIFGAEHPSTLISMHLLALLLNNQGRHLEAEQMERTVCLGTEKIFGAEHPFVLMSKHFLAQVLSSQGQYAEAEQMQRTILELEQRALGEKHPLTLHGMHNLACILMMQDRNAEAELLHRATVARRDKVLGPNHPDTLNSLMCLAILLQKRQSYDEARQLCKRASNELSARLGPRHPFNLASQWLQHILGP